MNYIINAINNKISILEGLGEYEKIKPHIQAKFEFYLIYILAYLWNKNIEKLAIEKKEYVINTVIKPSIGSIISTARTLDIDKDIFGNKRLKRFYTSIDSYPQLRNEKIGHGYSFEDNTSEYLKVFEELLDNIEGESWFDVNHPHEIIHVLKEKDNVSSGICYKSDGGTSFWSCPNEVYNFTSQYIYSYSDKHGYHKLSPFLFVENEHFFIFSSIEEKLTGRVKYNQLIQTGKTTSEFEEFATFVSYSDTLKIKSANGTIITKFEKQFKKYIDVGISKKITNFLLKNQSSVFATIWGYGGVGKTSAIQNVCEELSHQERKKFDYIIFLSAKDRYYNYYKGKIEHIDTAITSLDNIILLTNKVLFGEESADIDKIKNYEGKMLLVIDDFETFQKIERDRITEFIRHLNINFHKVIITTRSATLITGEEISANELDKTQTLTFVLQAIANEVPALNTKKHQKDIRENINSIWKITSGRPLFIFQFVILLGQKGNVKNVINIDIKELDEAKNFLYDRIYDYLSLIGKNMFLAISLLANKEDLTGPIKSLRFMMNMEGSSTEDFDFAFAELEKLKLVIRESDEIFKVYSSDVLQIMADHFDKKGAVRDAEITNRFNLISTSKEKDVDYAMLEVANSKRILTNDAEVENLYRRILNREHAPLDVKIKAISNYAHYLASYKKSKTKTLKLLKDYYTKFRNNPTYISIYSKYSWANGSLEHRKKAIKIIKDYISTSPNINEKIYLELLCSLMVYSSALVVEERENTKNGYRFNEISETKYHQNLKYQKNRFTDIYNYPGTRIWELISNKNLMDYPGTLRSSIVDALVHFCEINTRLKKYDFVQTISDKIFRELPPDYHSPFNIKLEVIDRINNPDLYDKYGRKKPDSVLGILLKEAINLQKKKDNDS